MLKILQQYVNWELPDVKTGFRKGRESWSQISNIYWIIEKGRVFQKASTASVTTLKPLTVGIITNYVKLLKRWEYQTIWSPSLETCAGQEATVRTYMEQRIDLKLGKEYIKAVYCDPAYLTYMQSIMRDDKLDEAQAGIKIVERNINNLRYADDTILMAESEELKSLLMKVKEDSEKVGLKLKIQKTKVLASDPITS